MYQTQSNVVEKNLIQTNVPLNDKNWFETGGPAKYYAEPTTTKQFQQALDFAKHNNLEISILGDGANSLISDDGFDGLVIKSAITDVGLSFNSPNGSIRMTELNPPKENDSSDEA